MIIDYGAWREGTPYDVPALAEITDEERELLTDELCEMLSKYHPVWINVHYNHPNELTPAIRAPGACHDCRAVAICKRVPPRSMCGFKRVKC